MTLTMAGEVTEYGKCLETGKRKNPCLDEKRDTQGAPNDLLDV